MSDLPYVIVRRALSDDMAAAIELSWGTDELWAKAISISPPPVSLEEIAEVLETVAGQIKDNWHHQPDDTPIVMGLHAHDLRLNVKLGDLRRASSLLSRLKGEKQ